MQKGMPTLGEEIKRRREERNITLNDVSESTRIGIRFLKAIEADNFAILPGGIFTRSFIRAFAKEVGLSEEEAMMLYNRQIVAQQAAEQQAAEQQATANSQKKSSSKSVSILQTDTQPVKSKQTTQKKKPAASTSQTNWSTILVGLGILVILAVLVTVVVRQLNKAQANKDEQARNAPVVKAPEPETANNSTSPSPSTNQEATAQNQSSTPAPTTSGQPPSPAVNSGEDLRVKLEAATGDSWVRYQADETPATQTTLKQGQAQDVPPAKNAVKIFYGNRLVLKVLINNREATLPETLPKFSGQFIISRDTLSTYFQPQAPATQ